MPYSRCSIHSRKSERFAGGRERLVSEVGSDVPVHKNNLAVVQGGFKFRLGFKAVAGIQQGSEVGSTLSAA